MKPQHIATQGGGLRKPWREGIISVYDLVQWCINAI